MTEQLTWRLPNEDRANDVVADLRSRGIVATQPPQQLGGKGKNRVRVTVEDDAEGAEVQKLLDRIAPDALRVTAGG